MKTKKLKIKFGLGCLFLALVFLPLGALAASENIIKIGVIGPMNFTAGQMIWKGAVLSSDQINAAGGIRLKGKNYQIKLIKTDDNCFRNLTDAVNAMTRLITVDKVKFVIGGYRSEAVLAQQDVMADNKIIFMGTGSSHPEQCLRVEKNYDRYKYWFRPFPIDSPTQAVMYFAMAGPALRAIRSQLGVEKPRVAILVGKAKWSDPIVKLARKVFTDMGCEVVGEWRPSWTAASIAAELSAIRSAGAHLIFHISVGPAGSVSDKEWGEMQIPAAVVGVNVEGMRDAHWENTGGKCNYASTADVPGPAKITKYTQPYMEAFNKKFGEYPTTMAIGGYDAPYILKDAIERIDSLDTEALVASLEKTDYIGPDGRITLPRSRDKRLSHQVEWGPNATTWVGVQWRDGKRVAYWPDGQELDKAVLAIGAPSGWSKVRFEGTQDYALPPWMVKYWKNKK